MEDSDIRLWSTYRDSTRKKRSLSDSAPFHTPTNCNISEVIRGVSWSLYLSIKPDFRRIEDKRSQFYLYDERNCFTEWNMRASEDSFSSLSLSTCSSQSSSESLCPTYTDIFNFIQHISQSQILEPSVPVVTAIYIDRFVVKTRLYLTPFNWRRIFLIATLIAEKTTEDKAVWNIDYLRSFPSLNLQDFGLLETQFLFHLHYDVIVPRSLFALYYFSLRTFMTKNTNYIEGRRDGDCLGSAPNGGGGRNSNLQLKYYSSPNLLKRNNTPSNSLTNGSQNNNRQYNHSLSNSKNGLGTT